MVAGMVMPLADLKAIYELLFKDGVIVAKKDKHPQSMHPDIKTVSNLQVIRAMGSLKSKGYIRETFAWKHAYYYLTNEGTAYLRDYLHLPPEIMPAPLQRVRRPASSPARIQTVKGPMSYIPKPGAGEEIQEAMMDRHIYHHKRVGEEREESEKPQKNFRGSYQRNAAAGQAGVQNLTFFKRGKDFCTGEERSAKEDYRPRFRTSCFPSEDRASRSLVSVKEAMVSPHSGPVSSKIPKDMSDVQMAPSAPVEVLQRELDRPAVTQPSAAFEESKCVKMQEAMIKKPTEESIPNVSRGATLNSALEVLGEVVPEPVEHVVMDQQTVPLLAELTEKEEQQCVLEGADSATTVEKLSNDVEVMNQLNVEDFSSVTKSKTPESDPDCDTFPLRATGNLRHLTEEKVADCGFADVDNNKKDEEETIPTRATSQFHVASETLSSAAFKVDCPNPVDLSECPDLEEEQEVQRVWSDFQEGLSSS
ncbi:uncharacterized protein LOC124074219 [Lates japonicus]